MLTCLSLWFSGVLQKWRMSDFCVDNLLDVALWPWPSKSWLLNQTETSVAWMLKVKGHSEMIHWLIANVTDEYEILVTKWDHHVSWMAGPRCQTCHPSSCSSLANQTAKFHLAVWQYWRSSWWYISGCTLSLSSSLGYRLWSILSAMLASLYVYAWQRHWLSLYALRL